MIKHLETSKINTKNRQLIVVDKFYGVDTNSGYLEVMCVGSKRPLRMRKGWDGLIKQSITSKSGIKYIGFYYRDPVVAPKPSIWKKIKWFFFGKPEIVIKNPIVEINNDKQN